MPINEIPLKDIEVFQSVGRAPIGALLQIADSGKPTVVLRCNQDSDDVKLKGVVFLEGELAGTFKLDEDLHNVPAISIGDFACVVVCDAAPRKFGTSKINGKGIICRARDSADNEFWGISIGEDNNYACLDGEQRGKIIRGRSVIYIGKAGVIPVGRRKDEYNWPPIQPLP